MTLVSRRLGLEGRFYSTPTSIIASFGKPEELRSCLLRTEPSGDIDLDRLCSLDVVADQVIHGTKTPTEGAQEVARIVAQPPRYGPWVTFVCFALAAAGAAPLFGGGWMEIAVATCVSLLIGIADSASRRIAAVNRVFEVLSGFLASAISTIAASLIAP